MTGFSRVIPILNTHADVFDYATIRRIMQLSSKAIDQNPQKPLLFLASHEAITIGFIGFQIQTEDPGQSELFGHVVKRGYQGQGVGTKLLRNGLDQLIELGVRSVTLNLKASAPSYVNKFYTKSGFKPSFNEEYTGASDENRTLVLLLDSPVENTPPNFYPA